MQALACLSHQEYQVLVTWLARGHAASPALIGVPQAVIDLQSASKAFTGCCSESEEPLAAERHLDPIGKKSC
jgi:hypothetical protein